MEIPKNPMKFIFSLILPVAFVATSVTGVAQERDQERQQQRAQMGQQCEATLELASVAPDEEMIHLNALFNRDIGETQDVSVEEQSGLKAEKGELSMRERQVFEQRRQDQQGQRQDEGQRQDQGQQQRGQGQTGMAAATPVRIQLNTQDANEGEWRLTFNGERGTCTAQIQVGQNQQDQQQQQYEQERQEEEQQQEEEEEGWPPLM